MAMRTCGREVSRGTPKDLIRAATLGARIAARRRLAEGVEEARVWQEVVGHYARDLRDEGYGDYEQETLMSAVQRGIDEALAAPERRGW
jgi:hypothetical protein